METLESYKRHVQRFGTEGVMDTAADDLNFEQLVELQILCNDKDRAKRPFARVRTRVTAEQQVKKLLGLTDEEPAQ